MAMNTGRRIAWLVCGVICLSLSACSQDKRLPAAVTSAFEQAFTRDDLAATIALFAEDAQVLPEHAPAVVGRPAIEQFLKDQMTPVTTFNTETQMTIVRRDLAVEQGLYRVRDVRRGSDVEEGKYVHVWRKVNGEWKIFRMIYNTDVAPDTDVSVEPAPEGEGT
jgi:ketosteroid isomerase-like protein